MKKICTAVTLCCCCLFAKQLPAQVSKTYRVINNNITLDFLLNDKGVPAYSVLFNNRPVINTSTLGFTLNNGISLDSNFMITSTDTNAVDESWQPVWGEVNTIRNRYKQLTVHLKQAGAPGLLLNIIFKVYEEGVGFRYEFPSQLYHSYFIISEEKTCFNLTGNHTAFWIPGDFDSNEYLYSITKLSEVNAWKFPIISGGGKERNIPDQFAVQTPLMLKTADGLYINIHEAALVNYSTMQLHVNRNTFGLTSSLVPDALGNKVYLRTPAVTPWRTIIVSDKAATLLSSKMILNLNEPCTIKNTSWIKPMKFVGVWWEMQTGLSSWNYTDHIDSTTATGAMIPHGHHGANTANVKRCIDFAAANNIGAVLVEGWNKGWEEWTGNWKEDNFDYVTPYPDFDIAAIAAYAKQKGVQMMMHNETGGSAANYDRQMDTAFRLMNRYGYPAVKTGYVGNIMPKGEHHDGQWMVNHYIRAAKKAAQYKVMIDMHEPTRPTGLSRTYPNFMASEAGRGNEWNAFSDGSPAEHETILPFTRLMGGPMDYTPGIFKLRNYAKGAPLRQMHTTLAKQLALYVTIYSPVQMAADLPENYASHKDAFQFIKDVPVDWDDTKIIEAEPGDYITIARKEKGKNNWFIGAITDEQNRATTIQLDFLEAGIKYLATIYEDAADADWKNNPEAYRIRKIMVDRSMALQLNLASGGGAAISIHAVK